MNMSATNKPMAFIDLEGQQARIGADLEKAIARVLAHGKYIMGPEVRELETALSAFCGAKHSLSCSNGTDALGLILMAYGLSANDAVLCPTFTFAATAEAIAWFGATPIFVDVDPDTYNMDPASLKAGLAAAKAKGLRPVGVITVDLFGQPADYEPVEAICKAHSLWILSDAAQSFGAEYKGRKVGTIGSATATSFFPAKPLGCYGDGGAVFTDDDQLIETLKSLRVHGQGSDKYDNIRIGFNGRLDTIQAAILLQKLRIFPEEIEARNKVAARYNELLANMVVTPKVMSGATSVWAQYTIRVPATRRDAIAKGLGTRGVPTAIYYPKPLHRQTAYRNYPIAGDSLPVSDRIADEVISLPMHPYLQPDQQDIVVEALKKELA